MSIANNNLFAIYVFPFYRRGAKLFPNWQIGNIQIGGNNSELPENLLKAKIYLWSLKLAL
jgi:hypothetical protein